MEGASRVWYRIWMIRGCCNVSVSQRGAGRRRRPARRLGTAALAARLEEGWSGAVVGSAGGVGCGGGPEGSHAPAGPRLWTRARPPSGRCDGVGLGTTGYGGFRTTAMLGRLEAVEAIVATARRASAEEAYRCLWDRNRAVVPYLGAAFGTKPLYFAADHSTRRPAPLIYDANVRLGLLATGQDFPPPSSFTTRQYIAYLELAERVPTRRRSAPTLSSTRYSIWVSDSEVPAAPHPGEIHAEDLRGSCCTARRLRLRSSRPINGLVVAWLAARSLR
jgi:Putative 8-oxoguanine DNA glycosylase OGG-like protein